MEALESFLVGMAVLAAALPFVVAQRRSGSRAALIASVVLGLASAGAFAWTAGATRPDVVAEEDVERRPRELPGDGYATSTECMACHPREYGTWHGSYHRRMTQVAAPETVIGDFAREPSMKAGEQTWTGVRRGDEFWVHVDPPGDGLPERRIVMTTGSHHMQLYWVEGGDDRRIQMAPFVWLVAEQAWIPRNAAFLQPPGDEQRLLPGKWNATCILCHATDGAPNGFGRAPQDIDTRVSEFGIACEACHGPADEHAELYRDPLRRYEVRASGASDSGVVQPAECDPVRGSQVCGQCHSVFVPHGDYTDIDGGRDFLPGGDLERALHVIDGTRAEDPGIPRMEAESPGWFERHFWADGMVRVSGREYSALLASPCYAHGDEAKGILSCMSCHNMHQEQDDERSLETWSDDQLGKDMETNAACTSCHAEYADDAALSVHTNHRPASSGSLCYNCHMPHTTYALLKAIRSHTIDSPDVGVTVATGRPNACNLCHLDRPLGWTRDRLTEWYGKDHVELDREQETIAASVVALVRGDAGARALAAWSLGWDVALEVSGRGWMASHLSVALLDAYVAVRYIAYRSLRAQPGFESFRVDWLAPEAERVTAVKAAIAEWKRLGLGRSARAGLLIDGAGGFQLEAVRELGLQRDERPLYLAE
jgi:hypothetical protein